MTETDGKTTQLQKGQASAAARIEISEERIELLQHHLVELGQRVAGLEAIQGIDQEPAKSFWNSTNGRYVIGALLVAFLAGIGWGAEDIAGFFSAP